MPNKPLTGQYKRWHWSLFTRKHTQQHMDFMPKGTGGDHLRKHTLFSLFQVTISKSHKDRLVSYRLTWGRKTTTASLQYTRSQMKSYFTCEDLNSLASWWQRWVRRCQDPCYTTQSLPSQTTYLESSTNGCDRWQSTGPSQWLCIWGSFLSSSSTLTKQTSSNTNCHNLPSEPTPLHMGEGKSAGVILGIEVWPAPLKVCS